MLIPEKEECLRLLDSMQMPMHIQVHSQLVCQVALLITDGLFTAGVRMNRDLVRASALLHDITKPRSFKSGENHAQTGGEHLASMGFFEVGEIVRQHVILDAYFAAEEPSEAEVVNYADKRVLHDRIVTLDDRMAYIQQRYAKTQKQVQRCKRLLKQTQLLEQRLFDYLPYGPDTISDLLLEAGKPAFDRSA